MSNIPADLKYSKEHEWIRVEEGNIAYVGITDFAQDQLGEIVYVEVETIDETIDQDEVFGSIEAVKTVSDLYLPVTGTIQELNEAIEDNPELVNESTYDKGWIVKIEMSDASQLDSLMSADEYQAYLDDQ